MYYDHILSWVVFLPIVAIPLLWLMPGSKARWLALIVTIVDFVIAIPLFTGFDKAVEGVSNLKRMQFTEYVPWIVTDSMKIYYSIGVDGVSIMMILLTLLIGVISVLASWNIGKFQRGYFAMFLLLQGAMLGVFVALDLILFYLFWEVMLFPMYFLIGIWGGPRRVYAAIKFFLYTLLGSVGMLLAILAVWY